MRYLTILLVCVTHSLFAQEQIETVIQKGHLQKVTCAAFHPSGKYLATGSADFSIKLWNTKTGKEIRSFNAHTGRIRTIKFSEDGSLILSTGLDNYVRLFNVLTGDLELEHMLGKEGIKGADFAPNGNLLLSDARGSAYLYSIKDLKVIGTYGKTHASAVKKNHISPLGDQIADLVNYNTTRLIPLIAPFDTVSLEFDKTNNVEFGPNGKLVALGSTKLFSTIYDAKTGKALHTLKDDPKVKCDGCNMQLAFSHSGKVIATGTKKTNLVLWNTSSGKRIRTLTALTSRPVSISFSNDDKYILVSDDKKVLVYETKSGKQKLKIESSLLSYFHPVFSPNGLTIIIPDEYNTASTWNVVSGKKQKTYKGYLNAPKNDLLKYSSERWDDVIILNYIKNKTEVALSPNGQYFIHGKVDTSAQIISTTTGKLWHRLVGHNQQVMAFDFSPNSKLVVTGGGDGKIIIWDVESGNEIKRISAHRNLIFDLKFNSLGTEIISSSWDGTIRTWNVSNGEETGYIDKGNASSYEVDFHPSNMYLISADLSKNLEFVELDSKEIFRSHKGHVKTISGFDFTNDGKYLISSSWDGSVKTWNGNTGALISKFKGHQGAVLSVVAHPTKNLAFSGGTDRIIHVFNPVSGDSLHSIKGHTSSVSSLSVSEQAGILVSCSVDGVVIVWDLDTYEELYTYISIDRSNWLAKNKAGYFDGTSKALKLINYVSGMESLSVSSFFKKYHTPGLQKRIMKGERFKATGQNIKELMKSVSNVETSFNDFQNKKTHVSNDSIYQHNRNQISLNITAKNESNIAEKIRIHNNGKLILSEPFKQDVSFRGATKQERNFEIDLIPGENNLEIVAINENGIESPPKKFTMIYDQEAGKTDLFLMTIGVNEYKNKAYTLNYARNDVESFAKTVEKGAKELFNEIYPYALHDADVTKEKIDEVFKEITSKIGPEDVFVLYYAGHGVMSTGEGSDPGEFYLVTHDVTNLFGDIQMLNNRAVSAKELMDYSREISAQKQLFIIDACQSGGALTAFATRGAPREKALAQLARSTGTFFLTASQDAQYANEVGDLKHGIFTYSILELLNGKPNQFSSDNKITVNEIKSYVETRVPELSKQFHGTEQYPTSYSFGQDFPLTVVNGSK
ncbi:MAG: WD40 repeat protein [Parvicellaceae bacterium]|jgi:WD40 repeat protein